MFLVQSRITGLPLHLLLPSCVLPLKSWRGISTLLAISHVVYAVFHSCLPSSIHKEFVQFQNQVILSKLH